MTAASTSKGPPLQGVPCDLCGSSRDQTLLTLPDMMQGTSDHLFRLARCRVCDLIYLNPRPYLWDVGSLYPEHYAPFRRGALGTLARNWLHQRSVSELANLLDAPRLVVDVGCGTGELLEQIRRAGNANIEGVEPSASAARIARCDRELSVRPGTLEQVQYPSESVDTVLLSHVLEHLPSPKSTLQEIDRILKPGGAVIIWVPNANSLAAKVLGRFWIGWDVPRHFYAFTPASLHRMLSTTSLKPGDVLHEKHAIEWSWGIRLWAADRFNNPSIDSALAKLHPVMSTVLTPIGVLSSALGMAGRIRLIAWKPIT